MELKVNDFVLNIILEYFKFNKMLNDSDIIKMNTQIQEKGDEIIVLNILKNDYSEKLEQIVKACIKNNHFTQIQYNELEKKLGDLLNKNDEKIEDRIIDELEKKDEPIEEEVEEPKKLEKTEIEEKIIIEEKEPEKKKISKKKEKGRSTVFTEEEIRQLIQEGKNLYKHIPGHLVPKNDDQLYAEIQLKRFIDSGGSDFIIETQKTDGMIYNMIKFKISGEHTVEDKTELALPDDESETNDNPFFASVRRYVGGSLGKMNTDKRDITQDSSFPIMYRNKQRDFRMSALPTQCLGRYYPRICIRLTSEGDHISLDNIEMLPFMKKFYNNLIHNNKAGMTAITGPTGSGKTTTIYGVLNGVDKIKKAVLAIETPIESQVHGINQTEEDAYQKEDPKDRYTNKHFLKSILRQAGDILFIGEMRDSEEVQEGVKMGLVGNKLITTFHTNSAVDTILRLKEEGVNNNAIGNGVKNITAQRLIKKLCPNCSQIDPNKEKTLKKIKKLFNRSRIHFEVELLKLLENLTIDELNNIELLEIKIQESLVFLSSNDIEGMINALDEKYEDFQKIKTKPKKIEFLNELFKDYPESEFRKYIAEEFKNEKLKIANPKGCDYEYENNGNNYFCENGHLSERIMIVEGLYIDKSIKRFIQDTNSQLIDLEKFLLNKGFVDMRMYGYILAIQGKIAIEKVDEVLED